MKIKSLIFKHTSYLGKTTENDLMKDLSCDKIKELERYGRNNLLARIKATVDSYHSFWVEVFLNGKLVYKKQPADM